MSRNFKDEMKRIADEKKQRELEAQRERQRKAEAERIARENEEAENRRRVRWVEENLKPYLEEINKTFLEGKGQVVIDQKDAIVKWNLRREDYSTSDSGHSTEAGERIILTRDWKDNTVQVKAGKRFFQGRVDTDRAEWRSELEDMIIKAVESGSFDF
jgi:hypothetical protein